MSGFVSRGIYGVFRIGHAAPAVACAGLLIVSGCASQPCDPARDQSIFKVAGCVVGGGYDARLAQLQMQLDHAEADRQEALSMLQKAVDRRDDLQAREARLRAELAVQRARSIRFQRALVVEGEGARVDRARLHQLEDQVTTLRAQQDALRQEAPRGPSNDTEMEQMRQRQMRLEQEWEDLRRVAPRD